MVEIHFYGILEEVTGVKATTFLPNEFSMVSEIEQQMHHKYPELKKYVYRLAVNHKFIAEDHVLKGGETLAFMPPFAGG